MISRADRIKNIAGKISGLPTLPTVISKMIELVDNPRTNTKTLAKLISNDQALTARILKMANSAYYGFSREVSTVDTAIIIMGYNAVKEMGLSLSVYDAFKNVGSIKYFDVSKYWEHSIAVGIAARYIAKKYGATDPGEMFVAGLLHDIGKMVVIQYMPDEFQEICELMIEKDIPYVDAENSILQINHGEIGYIIARKWHLPMRIATCIHCHHDPEEGGNYSKDAAIIDLADFICHRLNLGNEDHRPYTELESLPLDLVANGLEITDEDIIEIQEALLIELDSTDLLSSFS